MKLASSRPSMVTVVIRDLALAARVVVTLSEILGEWEPTKASQMSLPLPFTSAPRVDGLALGALLSEVCSTDKPIVSSEARYKVALAVVQHHEAFKPSAVSKSALRIVRTSMQKMPVASAGR